MTLRDDALQNATKTYLVEIVGQPHIGPAEIGMALNAAEISCETVMEVSQVKMTPGGKGIGVIGG